MKKGSSLLKFPHFEVIPLLKTEQSMLSIFSVVSLNAFSLWEEGIDRVLVRVKRYGAL